MSLANLHLRSTCTRLLRQYQCTILSTPRISQYSTKPGTSSPKLASSTFKVQAKKDAAQDLNSTDAPKKSHLVRIQKDLDSVFNAPIHAVDPSDFVKPSKQRRSTIFGICLALFVLALYTFSMYNLGQENFDDVRLPEETLVKLDQNRAKASST